MHILIVEDHPITALGVKMILLEAFEKPDIKIANNGKDALNFIKHNSFDVVILDIVLPNTDTQGLISNLKRISKKTEILILSNSEAKLYAMPYISMGASGYLNKSCLEEELVLAVKLVLAGQMYISKEALQMSMDDKHGLQEGVKSISNLLSNKELEAFTHLVNGERIKDISRIMNVHQSTASTLKKRIFDKLGVDNLIELKKYADQYAFE